MPYALPYESMTSSLLTQQRYIRLERSDYVGIETSRHYAISISFLECARIICYSAAICIFWSVFGCNAACSMTGSMVVMHFCGVCASEIAVYGDIL